MDVFSNTCVSQIDPMYEGYFIAWRNKHCPNDSGYDYDYRGYFNSGMPPPTKGLHWLDIYKKPNHPTFSNMSIYSTPEHPGGRWLNNNTTATFRPSAWMKADPERIEELKKYWAKYEAPKGNKLYLEEE